MVLCASQGTSDEVALLAAEFALLDTPLAGLADAISRGNVALWAVEDELDRLAADVPDLRLRLGISCVPQLIPKWIQPGWRTIPKCLCGYGRLLGCLGGMPVTSGPTISVLRLCGQLDLWPISARHL